MRIFETAAITCLAFSRHVHAKAVFAHFMITNTLHYTANDWNDDIRLAQEAHIQAFALNMAYGDPANEPGVAAGFAAASAANFKLFFSFDGAGNGPWPKQAVLDFLLQYRGNSAYFMHNGQPLASTFEGPGQADDWVDIKQQTGCFFIPSWSSKGAKAALELANGVGNMSKSPTRAADGT